ncbi:MAG: MoxR family ATPase [Gammaproteobacteria bacterium]|nr:MoxR family ATPase [Gammaproteobacteria bacterium]
MNNDIEEYPFNLIPADPEQSASEADKWLRRRPSSEHDRSFEAEAKRFVPGEALATAMNTALAVGESLLLTGEPGTGKTQAAYYAAWKLNTRVFHFQVKSETVARDLLYHFNTVQYFHDAHFQQVQQQKESFKTPENRVQILDKMRYVEKRLLWQAFEYGEEKGKPAVLLVDEIDKAPRDFPNDLLHELDKMEFTIAETQQPVKSKPHLRPIVFITSNSERRLPEPFLRRCVYHHIRFDEQILERAVELRRDRFAGLGEDFIALAIRRFMDLRRRPQIRKSPATGELLVWLRVLALALKEPGNRVENELNTADPADLPYLGVLLKDHRDCLSSRRE